MLMSAVVTELSEIVAVSVENQNVSPGGVGYQVIHEPRLVTLFNLPACVLDCGHVCTEELIVHVAFYTQPTSIWKCSFRSKDQTTRERI